MKENNAIVVENLSKCYSLRAPIKDADGNMTTEHWALKDVSFEIKKGESVGIIGPNGSGKSTLLKILAGITKPTSGKVTINGRVASILDVGAGFHPELSGRENVFLNGQIHGFSKKEIAAKFDEIVEFSGIEKFINEPVKNYSSGMFLRLAFSIIIHLDFDVYLFDEVMSVGDVIFKGQTRLRLKDLNNKNKTTIFVSHNISELEEQKMFLELQNGVLKNFSTRKKILMNYIEKNTIESNNKVQQSSINLTDFSNFDISDKIILKSIKFHQNSNNSFRTDLPFYLEINYDVLDNKNTYDPIITINDLSGVHILSSTPVLGGKVNFCTNKKHFSITCRIPPNFFTSRIYLINLKFLKNTCDLMSKQKMEMIDLEEALSSFGVEISFPKLITFSAIVKTDLIDMENFDLSIGGLIMPSFDWTTNAF